MARQPGPSLPAAGPPERNCAQLLQVRTQTMWTKPIKSIVLLGSLSGSSSGSLKGSLDDCCSSAFDWLNSMFSLFVGCFKAVQLR